ncbi:Dihydrodipicolinate reductase DapB [Helicobacter bizzozeronii]|uniref:4-hydroxy-tetrahydrodipicolinate reductase n=1 Tax=Helicobacter bizzozeronii TaxID=56877 RepID=UPI00244D84A2|nr:4-hydroxy-tetrahydrodipicolinate reductase [Helicobacter bizzozeronii]GMB92362.1 Dihydrodipicolinate reductase DapB [Helicobacter bizzozeronii]
MLNIGVFGASGKVGGLLVREIQKHSDLCLTSVFVRQNLSMHLAQALPEDAFVTNDLEQFLAHCDLVIDFSLPKASSKLIEFLLKDPKPLVSGTTGLEEQTWQAIRQLSQVVPVLHTPNMSVGMAVLNKIVGSVAKDLQEADIEITEMHHRYKKDAPSGSALILGQTCAQARDLIFDQVSQTKRENQRQTDEIGFVSLRGGDVVGKHIVGFYLDGEYLELTHIATDRNIFAKGALQAAKWLISQQPGLYNIQNLYV